MTANANTSTDSNHFIGRKIAAVVAAGALALGLSGCDSGNGGSENVNPVPSASQTDKPTQSNPNQESTKTETQPASSDSEYPQCADLERQQGVRYPHELKEFYRYGDDVNGDGKSDAVDIDGNVICA